MQYVLMYTTTLMVSFALTLILFLYHLRYWNPASHVPLRNIYLLNMTSALMCIVWCLVDGKPELIPINYIANIIEFNCMGFCGYFWLCYCLKFVDIPVLKTRWARILIALPVLTVMAMILSTPLTHWAFYIDDAGYFQRGTIYNLQQTGYVYLVASSVLCLVHRKKCTTSSERNRLNVLSMFPLSPAFFGVIQIIAPSGLAPTLQFSILISLILVFVDELDQKITRDSLTQLINRYEFERILQNKMHSYQKKDPGLFVMLSDMGDFKSINDHYGHQQGDNALRIVGIVLTKTAARHGAVCGRMSGDEFLSLLEADSPEQAEAYRQELLDELKSTCVNLPYTLHLSTGIAEYDGSGTMMELLNRADADMYAQKKLFKKGRPCR